jgi:hypothetical protein
MKKLLLIFIITIAIGICLCLAVFFLHNDKSFEEEVVEGLANYNQEHGHFPNCKNSNSLFDSLQLNLNYWKREDFDYKYTFDKKDNSCILSSSSDFVIFNSKMDGRTSKK